MGGATDGIRQDYGSTGAEVLIIPVQRVLVEWGEVIRHVESTFGGGQFEERVAVIDTAAEAGIGIEGAVAGFDIDIALGIGRGASTGLPDTAGANRIAAGISQAIGRGAEDADLLQACRVIAKIQP